MTDNLTEAWRDVAFALLEENTELHAENAELRAERDSMIDAALDRVQS